MLKGKNLTTYAEGAIEKLSSKLERATSESKIEKLTDRRDYWIQQWEKETGKDYQDDVIRTVEDAKRAAPGIPVFTDIQEVVDFMRGYDDKPETD